MSDYAEVGEEFLEHFGVKGMRWGKTKSTISGAMEARKAKVAAINATREAAKSAPKDVSVNSQLKRNKYKTTAKGGEKQPVSKDAVDSIVSRQKMKKSGMDSLSNQELKDLSTRMNLEVQVSALNSKRPKSQKDKFVDQAMNEATKDPVRTAAKGAEVMKKMRK